MPLKIIKHVTLYKDNRFHAAFPSIIKLDNDELLLAFRRARDCNWLLESDKEYNPLSAMDHFDPRSHICLINFDEELEQLSEPRVYPIDPEAGDQDPSLLNLGNGKILLAGFSWYPVPGYIQTRLNSEEVAKKVADSTGCAYRLWGSFSGLSDDHGKSWNSHHDYLVKQDDWQDKKRHRNIAGASRGQSIQLGNELLLATYGGGDSAVVWSSTDNGKNWVKKSLIAKDPENKIIFQEPTLYKSPSGKLVAFMRTYGADFRLATAQSLDNGETWEEYGLHDIKGQPFHAMQISEDKVLLTYGYREEPFGIRCCVTDVECEQIDTAEEIVVRDDGLCPDLGYPWAVEISDNRILVVYYWTDKDGKRQIQGSIMKLID